MLPRTCPSNVMLQCSLGDFVCRWTISARRQVLRSVWIVSPCSQTGFAWWPSNYYEQIFTPFNKLYRSLNICSRHFKWNLLSTLFGNARTKETLYQMFDTLSTSVVPLWQVCSHTCARVVSTLERASCMAVITDHAWSPWHLINSF